MMLMCFPVKTSESVQCPKMRVEGICNFLRYKRNEELILLINGNHEGCEPVRHVLTQDHIVSKVQSGMLLPRAWELLG
jgi:hypothetical protein